MSHATTVTVHRCGYWLDEKGFGGCGNERDCRKCDQFWRDLDWGIREGIIEDELGPDCDAEDLALASSDSWPEEISKPTAEISHADFVRQYGRCPDTCCVAEQLDWTERTA